MLRLLLGNLISLGGAIALGASCFAKERRTVYFCLFTESLLLAVAQLVFSMPAGAVALLVAAGRNLLVAFDRFGRWEAVLFSLLTLVCGTLADLPAVVGVLTDPRLFLNFLPVLAGVQLTIASHAAKSLRGVKYSILLNVFLWIVYSFYILDLVTALSNVAIFAIDLAALADMRMRERKGARGRLGK